MMLTSHFFSRTAGTFSSVTLAASLLATTLSFLQAKHLTDIAPLAFQGAEVSGTTAAFSFDMGTKRRNWTHNRWSVMSFPNAVDLRAFNGVTLKVSTDQPRRDVGVFLAVREADGTWYAHSWACELTQTSNMATVRFADFAPPHYSNPPGGGFKDENDRLDLDAINGVAIGVINPLGVGEVSFTLESLSFVIAGEDIKAAPITVKVTGELLDVNGTTTVPPGVFGSFNLKSIPTGEPPFMMIKGERLPIVDRKITYQGKEYPLDKRNRVRIKVPGEKKARRFTATVPSTPRAELFRSGSTRKIHFHLTHNPELGSDTIPLRINSFGDRTQPPVRVADPNWKQTMATMASNVATVAERGSGPVIVEFWNEPYLNWANDNRKAFNPGHYDTSKAAEGGPVHIRHDGQEVPHLKWTRNRAALPWDWTRKGNQEFRRGRTENGQVTMGSWARKYQTPRHVWYQQVADQNPPDSVKDGDTYTAKNGKTYTAFTPWTIYDETQFTFWSGKGMGKLYDEPLVEFARAAKEKAGEDVIIIAGWGNRPSEDHWAGFHQLYKPTIDASWKYIDGINDHDYGGSPLRMPANYEVVNAYSKTVYGKPLTFWNTEAASNMDPQAHGGAEQRSADAMKFQWVSRKIAQSLDTMPDKIRNISHFGIGGGFWSDGGEGVAFDMMRELRGRLVYVESPREDVYVVAAIDGTDPLAPRGKLGDQQVMTVLVLNDSLDAETMNLNIEAPTGATFAKTGRLRVARYNWNTGKPEIDEQTLKTDGQQAEVRLVAESRGPVVVNIPLETPIDPAAPAEVRHEQFLHTAVLEEVHAENPAQATIAIPSAGAVKKARLRLVVERLAEGEGQVVINGTTLALPGRPTAEGTPLILEMPIDPSLLKDKNEVIFQVTDPARAGYLLGMASIDTIR